MSTPQHGGSFSKPIDLLAGTEPYNHQWSIKSGSASNPPQFDLTAPLGAFPNSSQSTQQAGSPNTTPVRNHKAESSAPTLTPPSAPGATQKLSKAASNINPKFIPAAETTPHPDSSSSASLKSTGHHHTQAHHHPRLNISRARQAAALKLHALSSLSSKSDSRRQSLRSNKPAIDSFSLPDLPPKQSQHPPLPQPQQQPTNLNFSLSSYPISSFTRD
ncbi:hypothetical protein PCASD_15504 [Puccinia coronata f. sp. avenae]|uniref:Uncharacterized protein n=1 Tax=Puccinia coronata f. sp. avenae TaxID=200324 RepID=A0A2N5UCD6_9BASI|nr:hypothetical protein PCASD_17188 [Puccinia coronata f. sp. avenae]PLW35386.1 hypothetical protein PCASD_15504 [Puccinia coronata f. sp. avenae]